MITLHLENTGKNVCFIATRKILQRLEGVVLEELDCHITNSQNWFEMENLIERSFTFERTCFDVTFVLGVEEDVCPAICQKFLRCRSPSRGL